MKKLKPIGNNVILKGIVKKTNIAVADETQDGKLESIIVFAVADGIKSVKAGQEVSVPHTIYKQTERLVFPTDEKKVESGEFYILAKESEITGIYK